MCINVPVCIEAFPFGNPRGDLESSPEREIIYTGHDIVCTHSYTIAFFIIDRPNQILLIVTDPAFYPVLDGVINADLLGGRAS